MTQFPPFNLASHCPKCGEQGGGPDFVPDGTRVLLEAPSPFPVAYHREGSVFNIRFPCSLELHAEHLHRTCPRCGFQWAEACLEDIVK